MKNLVEFIDRERKRKKEKKKEFQTNFHPIVLEQ